MIKKLITLISYLVAGSLLFFTARRWLFILFALLPQPGYAKTYRQMVTVAKSKTQQPNFPSVLVLLPLRNEADSLPDLLLALDNLIYPSDKLSYVFINDGSSDNSQLILQQWTASRPNWNVLTLEQNVGKARALNLALAHFLTGEIIVIYDADERPQPSALLYLVQPFADRCLGGVSGRRAVNNKLASPAAGYTAYEGLVHQLITMRAKDRLNLAPAILGANCAYRRTALAQTGNFKAGALLEDSDLTLKLTRAGWKIRFQAQAISFHHVPETISGYWKQHTRWARGFNEVAKDQSRSIITDSQLSLPMRLELLTFSVGYLDRAVLFLGLLLMLTKNRLLIGAVFINLLTPLVQIVVALKLAKEPLAMWWRMIWLPLFFGIDIAMSLFGFWETIRQTPQIWEERHTRL